MILRRPLASEKGLPLNPEMFQFTMILHRIRIIVRDARLEHQTAASAVWSATNFSIDDS